MGESISLTVSCVVVVVVDDIVIGWRGECKKGDEGEEMDSGEGEVGERVKEKRKREGWFYCVSKTHKWGDRV